MAVRRKITKEAGAVSTGAGVTSGAEETTATVVSVAAAGVVGATISVVEEGSTVGVAGATSAGVVVASRVENLGVATTASEGVVSAEGVAVGSRAANLSGLVGMPLLRTRKSYSITD